MALSSLGLYNILDKQMNFGEMADFVSEDGTSAIFIKDSEGKERQAEGLNDLCQQFISRLKFKMTNEDYYKSFAATQNNAVNGAALAYEAVNELKLPNITQKLMTKK